MTVHDMTEFAQPYSGSNADMENFLVPKRTTAQLADVADSVNTLDKYTGKMAFNTTTGKPVYAVAATAAAAWLVAEGSQILVQEAGDGIIDGASVVYRSSVSRNGGIITTQIFLDMVGLDSATSDGDIIGEAATANPAHLGQITDAENGEIQGGFITCLELPAGASITLDIDFFKATVSTGGHEVAIGGLAGQVVILTKGGAWAAGDRTFITGAIADNDFLYMVNGEADTAATYTAGKFLIELYGIDP